MTLNANTPLQNEEDEIDLFEVVNVLLLHWRILLVFAILGLAGGVFYARCYRDVYQSDALLQLDPKKNSSKSVMDMASLFDRQSPAEAEINIIKSRQVLLHVVEQEKLRYNATPIGLLDRLMQREGRVDIELFEVPDALSLPDYKWILKANGDNSYVILSPFDESILLKGIVGETYRVPFASDTLAICVKSMFALEDQMFLLTRTSAISAALALQKKLEVESVGKNTNILTLTIKDRYADRAASVLNAVAESYVRQNVEMRSAEAEKTLEFLEKQLPGIKQKLDSAEQLLTNYRNKAGTVDLGAEARGSLEHQVELKAELLKLEKDREEKSRLYTDDHPIMQAIIQQQERLRKEISKEDSKIKKFPTTQQEVLKLQQDVEINNVLYATVLNNIQQLRVVRAGEIGNVRIVDKAYVPYLPVKQNRKLLVLMGLGIGLFIGACLVFIMRKFKTNGVGSSSILEQETGVPVYVKVPKVKIEKALDNVKDIRFVLAKAEPANIAVEKLRALRMALDFSFTERNGKVLMVSGITPHVGKSFVSLNLTYLYAEANKKVLLLDADLRKSRLSNKHELGLSDVLSGRVALEKAIVSLGNENAFYLPIGKRTLNSGELLSSDNFKNFVENLKTLYDIIVIDTPPMPLVSDAQAIARLSDFCLAVLHYKKHSLEEIKDFISLLDTTGLTKRAFVFNDYYRDTHSDYYYSDYYYSDNEARPTKKGFLASILKK